jgi:WXG100 family type VII secretion target
MSGTVTVGSQEFTVDLEQFSAAITTVSGCQSAIESYFSQIASKMSSLEDSWVGPAGSSYAELQSSLVAAGNQMIDVLSQIVQAMRTTYGTYLNAETTNAANLS